MTTEQPIDYSPEESAQEKRLRFLERQNKPTKNDALALFAIGTFGLHIVSLLALVLLYGSFSNLARKEPPSLVQLDTGRSITVAPLSSKERTPKVISRFVVDTLTLMMNWSGTLPATTVEEATKPKLDPGVKVGNGKVSTSSWQASFALSEDFRKEFLVKLAQLTPSGVFNGNTQVTLVPLEVQVPQQISEGKWKIKIVANLMVFERSENLGNMIPFNKEVFVQAVEAPDPPADTTGMASVIYAVRSSGLEITAIRDLEKENL
ncbi:hypothetical protein [Floridanema evergladense]|uniref:Uncharacterized protein n=1 Tax=Floridaenema evergladense BLCC-F167 TaxID=3153639 RepID=A0ABV4WH65_9CYAN